MKRSVLSCLMGFLVLAACSGDRDADDHTIQFSSSEEADFIVTLTEEAEFSPPCREIIAGDTVLWRNNNESVPIRVVSVAEPFELVSPMLRGRFQEWTHTFETSGIFDYFDPFSGDLGRRVEDAYYGTVTFIGESGTVTRGRICVKASASDNETCANQCCPLGTDAECAGEQTCQNGICRDPA